MHGLFLRIAVGMLPVAAMLLTGCGRRDPAPAADQPGPADGGGVVRGVVTDNKPAPAEPTAKGDAPNAGAQKKSDAANAGQTDDEKYERLLRDLAEAREPSIYFTLTGLHKPELRPHLAKFHADPEKRAKIADGIWKIIAAERGTSVGAAADVLQEWVVPEQVPTLIEFMEKRGRFKQAIIEALANIKDPRCAEVIGNEFPHFRDRCSKCLVKLGPELSRNVVIPHINYPDNGVRGEAQRLATMFGVKFDALLEQTFKDLKNDDPKRRANACEWLQKADAKQERRAEIAKALEPHITDTKSEIMRRALPALLKFAGPENIPCLVDYLKDEKNKWDRKSVVLYLGKTRDARAVGVIVRELETNNGAAARDAVKEMGPAAEKEVAKLLEHEVTSMRANAAILLQSIGTKDSVPALERAANDSNSTVQTNAKKALRDIAARSK